MSNSHVLLHTLPKQYTSITKSAVYVCTRKEGLFPPKFQTFFVQAIYNVKIKIKV